MAMNLTVRIDESHKVTVIPTERRNGYRLAQGIYSMSHDEGIGSIYEHFMLRDFFENLMREHDIRSVLELRSDISKGLDNVTFCAVNNCQVTLLDPSKELLDNSPLLSQEQIRRLVKTRVGDETNNTLKSRQFDLVWNFAIVQRQENPQHILGEMARLSKRLVLVFVPNGRNLGRVFHKVYHLISKRKCHHAERGYKQLMLLENLTSEVCQAGLNVIRAGYIDIPPFPDIAVSIREWKSLLFRSKDSKGGEPDISEDSTMSVDNIAAKVDRIEKLSSVLEKSAFRRLKSVEKQIAHHMYVLGEVQT